VPGRPTWIVLLGGLACGCAPSSEGVPDGSGSATIEPRTEVPVGSIGAWKIHYAAGPQGLPLQGRVVFHLPLYWHWTRPQNTHPQQPGHVRVERSSGLEVGEVGVSAANMYVMVAPGRGGLDPGEILTLHYGRDDPERPSPVRADPFAEDAQVFKVAVDGDGDGVFADIADPPSLRLVAGPALRLWTTLGPSLIAPGAPVRVTVAPLDGSDNLDESFAGEVELFWVREGELVDSLGIATLRPRARGTMLWTGRAPERPGRYRALARHADLGEAQSNPTTVRSNPGSRRLVWADLHGHSALSDGTGAADDYHFYARHVAGLDAAALTDHDQHGLFPLSAAAWAEQQAVARRYHEPGVYVAVMGYEYTNWVTGHRNVYFRDEGGPVRAWTDSLYDTPSELFAALDSSRALTVPHHTAGQPIPIDWAHHDPALEPVVEISSVHGVSERVGAPGAVRGAKAGHTVIDALNRGYRLAFIGSGDGHVGHPGRRLEPFPWGMAGLWVDELSREGIFRALKRRSVFATTGPRIVVRFALEGVPMGGVVRIDAAEPAPLVAIGEVLATAPIERIEIVQMGEARANLEPEPGPLERRFRLLLEVQPGDYLYLRVSQRDGAMAWSSPIWIEEA